ncbi:MAG: hypothetical protein MPK62_05045, partial [Alphaproteobacteria bacterium]|nr:hypothetical protein [Alphaproteobacteria bacterium]
IFLRASPHPSAGIARLSQHRECLSQSLTNAKDWFSVVSLIMNRRLVKNRLLCYKQSSQPARQSAARTAKFP